MSLIYLDTSHFSLLENIANSNPSRFERFVKRWKASNLTLALSKAHIEEILQLKRSDSRVNRFKLIQNFMPLRYEGDPFFSREIYLSLFKLGILQISEEDRQTDLKIFSRIISESAELELLQKTHNAIRSIGLYKLMSFGNRISWKSKEKDKFHVAPKPRLKSVQDRFFFKVFARFIGVDPTNTTELQKTFENQLRMFLFRTQLRSTLKTYFPNESNEVVSKVSNMIKASDCPGLWLRNEIEIRLKLSHDFKPNNEKDLDHIQYLPYVDHLFTDKRIVEMTTQVLRSQNLPESLKQIQRPINISQSLEALESALFNTTR